MTSDAARDQGWVDPLPAEDVATELERLKAELEQEDTSPPLTMEQIRALRAKNRKPSTGGTVK